MTTTTQSRCECGNRMSRYAHRCRKCDAARAAAIREAARIVVATGKCPDCGAPLLRNSALSGWWQCAGYACPEMRNPEFRDLPKCCFQTFTEYGRGA